MGRIVAMVVLHCREALKPGKETGRGKSRKKTPRRSRAEGRETGKKIRKARRHFREDWFAERSRSGKEGSGNIQGGGIEF